MIRVPVTIGFDHSRVIGFMEVDEELLPDAPDFVFAIGFRSRERGRRQAPGAAPYILLDVGLVQDTEYAAFLADQKRKTEEGKAA